MKTKPCRCCTGSGKEIDHIAFGAEMREARIKAGLSLTEMKLRLGFSQPYLSDLERGLRNWRPELAERYQKALLIPKPKKKR